MKKLITSLFIMISILFTAAGASASETEEVKIKAILVNFHDAAAKGDKKRYFNIFAQDAMFLGTDESEHWVAAKGLKMYFKDGKGWAYIPEKQYVYVAKDGKTAWFDEVAVSKGYGRLRGTGVFVMENGTWKMAHYSLTFLVPNEIAGEVVAKIMKKDK
jgi:hypothetical protein